VAKFKSLHTREAKFCMCHSGAAKIGKSRKSDLVHSWWNKSLELETLETAAAEGRGSKQVGMGRKLVGALEGKDRKSS